MSKVFYEWQADLDRLVVRVENDDPDGPMESDQLMFVFTREGVIIDAVTGGIVEATQSTLYEDIEEDLIPLDETD